MNRQITDEGKEHKYTLADKKLQIIYRRYFLGKEVSEK